MNRDRRQFIIAISACSFAVASGCATFRRGSELDTLFAELDELLSNPMVANSPEVATISEKIREGSDQLLALHGNFATDFNAQAADRDAPSKDLEKLVNRYDDARLKQRSELFGLQDELHSAVPDDLWPDIRDILNRKSQAVTAETV